MNEITFITLFGRSNRRGTRGNIPRELHFVPDESDSLAYSACERVCLRTIQLMFINSASALTDGCAVPRWGL